MIAMCLIFIRLTYPSPNSNSVFVNEAHFDEFPLKTKEKITLFLDLSTKQSFCVWVGANFMSQKQVKSSFIKISQEKGGEEAGGFVCLRCIDLSKQLLARLTWPLLSDLPPHRFPDVCRFHALTCRPGNRFLFRRSWRRWFSQCWPGMWPSSLCRDSLLSGCKGLHTWKSVDAHEMFLFYLFLNAYCCLDVFLHIYQ